MKEIYEAIKAKRDDARERKYWHQRHGLAHTASHYAAIEDTYDDVLFMLEEKLFGGINNGN